MKEDGFGQVYEIISSHERVTWTGLINSIFLHFLSNLFWMIDFSVVVFSFITLFFSLPCGVCIFEHLFLFISSIRCTVNCLFLKRNNGKKEKKKPSFFTRNVHQGKDQLQVSWLLRSAIRREINIFEIWRKEIKKGCQVEINDGWTWCHHFDFVAQCSHFQFTTQRLPFGKTNIRSFKIVDYFL